LNANTGQSFPMKKLHLEIDSRYGGYITPSLTRTLEQAARCGTLDQAENVLRAQAPRTWWAVSRKPSALAVSHIWQGREPVLCARVVEGTARGRTEVA
jgi:hypothetical protein